MHIIPVIFWGSTILSIGLSATGLVRRSPWMLVAGAILAGPISFYLGATPRFRIWAFFLPCLQIAAAVVVRRSVLLAALLLVPLVCLAILLAALVAGQEMGAA